MIRTLVLTVILTGFFILPGSIEAQGLVPVQCTGNDPSTCGSCEFVQLINNVIQFIILLASSVAVLIFMYAGFRLVTSGGDVSAKEDAKKKFSNVVIGYVIILAAFLVIDLLLGTLVDDQKILNWRTVECVYPNKPDPDKTFARASSSTLGLGAGSASCNVPIGGGGECSTNRLLAAGFPEGAARQANAICSVESGFDHEKGSAIDQTDDKRPYSIGLFQVNLSVHELSCGGTTLDCKSAFEDTGERNKFNVKIKRVINEDLYQQCVTAAKTPACNIAKAKQLFNQSGDFGDWACSTAKCGISTTRNHLCPL